MERSQHPSRKAWDSCHGSDCGGRARLGGLLVQRASHRLRAGVCNRMPCRQKTGAPVGRHTTCARVYRYRTAARITAALVSLLFKPPEHIRRGRLLTARQNMPKARSSGHRPSLFALKSKASRADGLSASPDGAPFRAHTAGNPTGTPPGKAVPPVQPDCAPLTKEGSCTWPSAAFGGQITTCLPCCH